MKARYGGGPQISAQREVVGETAMCRQRAGKNVLTDPSPRVEPAGTDPSPVSLITPLQLPVLPIAHFHSAVIAGGCEDLAEGSKATTLTLANVL